METLFTSSKWDILQHLGNEPLSPLQIAQKSNTSLANISQQLRLLEMAGLVKSQRIPNRDKGQPRLMYSLASDQSYLITAANDFVEKRMLQLSALNKVTLRIWFYEDPNVRYVLEKSFWQVEHLLPKMKRLGVQKVSNNKIRFCVASDTLKQQEFPSLEINDINGTSITVEFNVSSDGCLNAHLLYEQ